MNNVISICREDEDIFKEKFIKAKGLSKIFIDTVQGTYDNWVKMGLLTRYKIGGGVYYKVSEVKKLIKNSIEYSEVG